MGLTIDYLDSTPANEVDLIVELNAKGYSLARIKGHKSISLHTSGIQKILIALGVYRYAKARNVYFPQPKTDEWSTQERHYGKDANLKYTWESLCAEEKRVIELQGHRQLKVLPKIKENTFFE